MTADEQLAEARSTLDTHLTCTATGRCRACGTSAPCWRRETAVAIFSRTVRVPHRAFIGTGTPELTERIESRFAIPAPPHTAKGIPAMSFERCDVLVIGS